MASRFDTPEAFNQSPPYADIDLFGSDRALQDAVAANGAGDEAAALAAFGRRWGSAPMFEQARLANENPPKLRAFDARAAAATRSSFIRPITPSWRRASARGCTPRLGGPTARRRRAPAEVARAARYYMVAQVENGHMCPITMTRASVAALRAAPDLAAAVLPKILSRQYDPAFRPWTEKSGMTLGMGMTEKQGGTDVRANTTRAEPDGDGLPRSPATSGSCRRRCATPSWCWRRRPGGLTCFFMPRFRPDGSVNALHFQRLKDKLGNRSNASSEVEFEDAYAERVGDEGAGHPHHPADGAVHPARLRDLVGRA